MIIGFNEHNCQAIILENIVNNNMSKDNNIISYLNLYDLKINHNKNSITLTITCKNNLNNETNHKPLYIVTSKLITPKLILKLTANSKVAIIDHQRIKENTIDIICQENSILNYYLIQEQVTTTINITQKSHSQLNAILLANPKYDNSLKFVANLSGTNSKVYTKILQNAKLQAQHNIELSINHLTTYTESNTLARIISKENSRLSLTGKINVPKNMGNIKADLQSKGLIIGTGKIINRPELNIEHNEVICSHGASIGSLDPEALIYMQAKGIDLLVANELLLAAFQEPILKNIPYQPIINYLLT